MRRLLPVALLLSGCATTAPRFSQDVAASFTQDMRHLVTDDVDLYYPAQHREAALKVAARAKECLTSLRARSKTARKPGRALLFLTDSNFNNAEVSGQFNGEPLHSLNVLFATSEYFPMNGLGGADVGDIACHEMLHYAHFEQVEGLWRILNLVVGEVVPAQWFVERWYMEGVAQYYEGRIRKRVGRPATPLYQAQFDSYVAMRGGHLNGGDLSPAHRELTPASGAYLTSYFFVQWLAEKYGEDKLWEVMELQGRSIFSPFGVTLRFKAIYGKSIGALLDDWSAELSRRPARERRADQRVLRDALGQYARLASHAPTGTLALLTEGNEEPPTLRILNRDGSVRLEERLQRFSPSREWVFSGPSSASGLSFSADGRFLYLLNDDLASRGDTTGQIWKVDTGSGEVVQVQQGVGTAMGGAVHPDGSAYTVVTFKPGQNTLVDVNLSTGARTPLGDLPPGVSVAGLDWSPDGKRLVYSRLDAPGWNLVLREADGTTRALTHDGAFNYGARWTDDHTLVFARTFEGRSQLHRLEVNDGTLLRLSDVPFGMFDPAPLGDAVAMVNRVGSQWSLDVVPATSLGAVAVEPGPEPSPPEPAPPLTITSDGPYSPVDHLFIPELRAPQGSLSVYNQADGSLGFYGSVGLALEGRDRLSRHAWSLEGTLTIPTLENWEQISYTNLQLAPWQLSAAASRTALLQSASYPLQTVFWSGAVSVSRSVFTVPLSLGFGTLVRQRPGAVAEQFIGPRASASWGSLEATSYGGAQRGFAVGLNAAAYPSALGSSINMADLQASLGVALPLPLSRRHSLVFSVVGRTLVGAPDDALRVGGIGRGYALYSNRDSLGPLRGDALLPTGLYESVRGYEDYSLLTRSAAIAVGRYRYSLIIDRGFASTFYILPSAFFRQVDVEAFGTAVLTDGVAQHTMRAVGASLVLRTLWGSGLPISLIYQFAWRFDFGLTQLHTISFSFE